MTRLGRHVLAVQNRMTVSLLLRYLSASLIAFSIAILATILADRFLAWRLPRWELWIVASFGACIFFAIAFTLRHRPTKRDAAIAIDERLALKERFATALYARPANGAFEAATVIDAEMTAARVSPGKRFPVRVPRLFAATSIVMLITALTALTLKSHPLFARTDPRMPALERDARQAVKEAIARVETAAKGNPNGSALEGEARELKALLARPIPNPAAALARAESAMRKVEAARPKVADEVDRNRAKPDWRQGPLVDPMEKSPNPADGLAGAAKELERKSDPATPQSDADRNANADAIDRLARKFDDAAKDDRAEHRSRDLLRGAGIDRKTVDELTRAAEAASNGDPKAKQAFEKKAEEVAGQIQKNPNLNDQQRKQLAEKANGLSKDLLEQATARNNAGELAKTAKEIARGMRNGDPQPGAGGKGLAELRDKLKVQMAKLPADADSKKGGDPGEANANGPGDANGRQPGNPAPGRGVATGPRPKPSASPFSTKVDQAPTQEAAGNRSSPIAEDLVRSMNQRGESTAAATSRVIKAAREEATDDIEADRVSAANQESVKRYFDDLQQATARPTTNQ